MTTATATETTIKAFLKSKNVKFSKFIGQFVGPNVHFGGKLTLDELFYGHLDSGMFETLAEHFALPVEIFPEPVKLRVYDYLLARSDTTPPDVDSWLTVYPEEKWNYSTVPVYFTAVAKWGDYYLDAKGNLAFQP